MEKFVGAGRCFGILADVWLYFCFISHFLLYVELVFN